MKKSFIHQQEEISFVKKYIYTVFERQARNRRSARTDFESCRGWYAG